MQVMEISFINTKKITGDFSSRQIKFHTNTDSKSLRKKDIVTEKLEGLWRGVVEDVQEVKKCQGIFLDSYYGLK